MNKSALFRLEGGGNIIFIGLFELFFFCLATLLLVHCLKGQRQTSLSFTKEIVTFNGSVKNYF